MPDPAGAAAGAESGMILRRGQAPPEVS
jgi:hypothetical protein